MTFAAELPRKDAAPVPGVQIARFCALDGRRDADGDEAQTCEAHVQGSLTIRSVGDRETA